MSISMNGQTFHLRTKNTSYIMDVYKGYLRHLYYGNKLEDDCYDAFYKNYFVGSYCEAELNTKDGSTLEVIPQNWAHTAWVITGKTPSLPVRKTVFALLTCAMRAILFTM